MRKNDLIASATLGLLIGALLPFVAARSGKDIPYGVFLFLVFSVLAPAGLWVASLLGHRLRVLYQIGKFGIVGTANFVVDVAVFHAVIVLMGSASARALFFVSAYAVTTWTFFKALSFIVANAHSFFWNKFWTFQDKDAMSTKEYGAFFSVSLVGLFINSGAFSLVFALRPESASEPLWGTIGAAAGAVASLAWNFVGYKFFVFK